MKTVAVIFGGRSTEHDVSIMTAIASVIRPLELSGRYRVEPIYITKKGSWHWDPALKDITLYQSGKIDEFVKKDTPISIEFSGKMQVVKSKKIKSNKTAEIDVVFPAMHGTHGEDGELMGVLEMAQVPYVGCDMPSSVIAMDKVLAKQVTESAGIASTPWIWFWSRDLTSNKHQSIRQKISRLKYPLFVKPAHLGSSIGITKVSNENDLDNALELAAHYDNKVIVEQAVEPLTEVTLPIMGNTSEELALLERPLVAAEDFFDFDTKYMHGGKGKKASGKQGSQGYSELPAKLDPELYTAAEKVSRDAYDAIGCCGIARVDLLINSETREVFFNEVNPLPGDLYLHNWRKAGKSAVDIVDKLIDYAMQRYNDNQRYATVFSTNYLRQFKQ
jgi:D-alanine-D-alanine ligase